MKPLLFVCRYLADEPAGRYEPVPLESPDGPVLQAFESHELASMIVTLYGTGPGVFLLSESTLGPEDIALVDGKRMVVYRTGADYAGATRPDPSFPWLDRVIRYDARSARARLE